MSDIDLPEPPESVNTLIALADALVRPVCWSESSMHSNVIFDPATHNRLVKLWRTAEMLGDDDARQHISRLISDEMRKRLAACGYDHHEHGLVAVDAVGPNYKKNVRRATDKRDRWTAPPLPIKPRY
jgi:hypothetical protein